ncbi:MAG: type I-E CRISPR-associated protein Cse2/CasB [Desulfobaccales bacterium]
MNLEERFIGYLESLVKNQDRGALAQLRRGLGKPPGAAPEMHRYVVPFLPATPSPTLEEAYYLIAALFAFWHQGKDTVASNAPPNLGASLACMVTKDNEDSIDRRFTALLKSHPRDLSHHMRQAIGFLKSKEVPVAWQQLLRDILNWEHPEGFVQRDWARAFWGRRAVWAPPALPETPEEEITA